MQPIFLNTGLFLKKDVCDTNGAIQEIDKRGVEGIEISTSFLDHLMNFRVSQESFATLKKYQHVGINAPAKFHYRNDRYTFTVLTKLRQVYDLVQAQFAVFHMHTIDDYTLLDNATFKVCIENDRVFYGSTPEKVKAILDEHPNIGFVLNTAHALSVGPEEVARYVELVGDRIVAVHLSSREGDLDHSPLSKTTPELLEALEPVRSLDVPFVLEVWHTFTESLDDEIIFVRDWLHKSR